jgi:hypothetical protein
VFSVFRAFRYDSKLAFPLRSPSVFCVSSLSLGLKIRIPAAVPLVFSVFLAFRYDSKLACPLRFSIVFCVSRLSLGLKIRIPAAFP